MADPAKPALFRVNTPFGKWFVGRDEKGDPLLYDESIVVPAKPEDLKQIKGVERFGFVGSNKEHPQ